MLVASTSSPCERFTRRQKPFCENLAPAFCVAFRTTSRLPRPISASVTSSLKVLLFAIASQCAWLLDCAVARRTAPSRHSDWVRIGPATLISSSLAKIRVMFGGAFGKGRQMLSEQCSHRGLNFHGQPGNHGVKQVYFVPRKTPRTLREEIGNYPRKILSAAA